MFYKTIVSVLYIICILNLSNAYAQTENKMDIIESSVSISNCEQSCLDEFNNTINNSERLKKYIFDLVQTKNFYNFGDHICQSKYRPGSNEYWLCIKQYLKYLDIIRNYPLPPGVAQVILNNFKTCNYKCRNQ